MTCNPKWREITQALLPGQTAFDRPDLLTRVFKLKLDMLLDELYKDGIFGKVIANLHVIEFQKRGLPHAHILIILDQTDRPLSADAVDEIVRAELPHAPAPDAPAEEHAEYNALVKLVVEQMTHNDCTCEAHPTCMYDANNKRRDACKAHFPKEFHAETTFNEMKIYPQYRRRAPEDGGATYTTAKGRVIDNRWITPCARPAAPPVPPACRARFVHAAYRRPPAPRPTPRPPLLGQLLAILTAQVPVPPERRGVRLRRKRQVPVQVLLQGPRPRDGRRARGDRRAGERDRPLPGHALLRLERGLLAHAQLCHVRPQPPCNAPARPPRGHAALPVRGGPRAPARGGWRAQDRADGVVRVPRRRRARGQPLTDVR